MLRAGPIALLAALCALLVAPAASGQVGGGSLSEDEMYWLGPYYAGLRLEGTPDQTGETFVYGDCELPEGEGGCSPPLEVQNWTSCTRNPIGLDVLPYKVYLLRGGGLAAAYEPTSVDVGTGHQTVTVFTNEVELMGAALRDVRRKSEAAPQPLPPPVYPMPVLRELKRVTAAAKRFDGVGAIAKAIDLPPAEVELRLRIAKLLGPGALAGVPVPTMSTDTVERLRQLSFDVGYDDLAKTARKHGMTVAELKAKIRRVRGLAGDC
ncbi:MAG TPA: hypothetical protein VFP21_03845 [Solirubrobacterales bacterium]|nr:hypothetical protein [Solirubrobacterales bacterium]